MTPQQHPPSYTTLNLPDIKLEHHPATSPTVTPTILILLHRPNNANAFTDPMASSLVTALDLLSSDPRVRAVALSSSDPRNRIFCAGMDLSTPVTPASLSAKGETLETHRDTGGLVSLAIHRCHKPVIAAINGSAVGVGVTMTLPCNLRIASSSAKVGLVFARRGITMEGCSSYFLPRILGPGRALQLVTTGATYPTTSPLVRDLFAEVVPPEKVLPRALELADEIGAQCSAVSIRAMRDMLFQGGETPYEAHRLESKVIFDMFSSRDCKEGIESFLQKREVRFEGTVERDMPRIWPWWKDAEAEAGIGGNGRESKL